MRRTLIRYIPVLFAVFFLSYCSRSSPESEYERANDPWVFRSVLDQKARMLTVALHPHLWLAYDAETGAMEQAWQGNVELDGAVYTTAHGPQPLSQGGIWMQNEHDEPWQVSRNGQKETPTVQYRGHRFKEGQVYIQTELSLADGQKIMVSERPEYITNESGQTGLERTFFVENLPADAAIFFQTGFQSIPSERSIQTDGDWQVRSTGERRKGEVYSVDVDGRLGLRKDGPTRLSAFFVRYPLIPNENASKEEMAALDKRPLGERLIERSGCKTCHNTYVKTIGPAYVAVAERYRNTEENIDMLVKKVKNGGSGVWGEAAMTPNTLVEEYDIRKMVSYIMDLDAAEEALEEVVVNAGGIDIANAKEGAAGVAASDFRPGIRARLFFSDRDLSKLDDVKWNGEYVFEGILPNINAKSGDFADIQDNFGLRLEGYIRIPATNNYVFRLSSDDGSRMVLDGQEIIDNDGLHGAGGVDAEMALQEGYHPFRVDFFQGAGGKSVVLEFRPYGSKEWAVVPASFFLHHNDQEPTNVGPNMLAAESALPGDGMDVAGVHPSYDLSQARPNGFSPKVGGMDFMSDGRLVISTWDAEGAVYVLDGVESGDPSSISYKKVATGLAEPLGVKVVNDTIYVLQKQELTQLIDYNGDDLIDEYRTLSNDWEVSANFHEFAFGLAYRAPYFYGSLAIAILPGGASANPQIPDRGKAFKVHKTTGELDIIAEGLRTPNGVGFGVDDELFIADNQGDWLPSSKILHVNEGDFFGSRAVDSARVANMPVKQPVVWLPQDEIGNSPSTPAALHDGPYAGQMIHGEVTHGGVKRVFVEKVAGEYQGAVFRFIQGLEAGVNRLVWGPDSALYIGGIGSTGNWQQSGKLFYGLQRLKYNGKSAFEMLAVRAKSNGMEIELTEALPPNVGWNAADYIVQQWWYKPTKEYGGPKLNEEDLPIRSVNISPDRKKIFLELGGLKPQHVVYIRLPNDWTSEADHSLWSTEAWYTLNSIPENTPGFSVQAPAPIANNTLTPEEKAGGWKLLFDGQTTAGWHNYRKTTIGSSWKVDDGALYLDSQKKDDGGWQAADGGDIICEEEYEDFELRLEWRISPCGNSGIMFNVTETDKFDHPWQTGPEMQVLDNTCHPDAVIITHRAGDLYDMISAVPETVRPAGNWNKVRLRSKDGLVQHWLNGRKVVEYRIDDQNWKNMIANSKFKDMEGFGMAGKGRIALQDHGDRVWFRNIKIKTFK